MPVEPGLRATRPCVLVPDPGLVRGGGVPLAAQLAAALREHARQGVWRPGDRLPSTRELARDLRVSRTVTEAAYDQLLAEGWLESRRGAGTFVAAPAVGTTPRAVRPATHAAGPSAAADHRRAEVDLRAGAACVAALDAASWRRAWRAAAASPPATVADPIGASAFRVAAVEHLLRHRGLVAGADELLATAGTTAAIAEVARVLPAGSLVAVEDPGYGRAVAALRAAGLTVHPVPVDDEGLVVGALPVGQLPAAPLRAVYCTPAHQYPLGRRMSAARRVALVERARREGFLVIEDDYDGELRYDVAPLPLLAALGPDVVVHLGTTSKILSPTLGVGWLVAPPAVRAAIVAARVEEGARPAPAGQLVLAALAAHGDLGVHLRRLRRELAARRGLVVASLTGAGHRVEGEAAGAHVVLPLPDADAEARALARAATYGLRTGGLARHYLGAGFGAGAGSVAGVRAVAGVGLAPGARRHGLVVGFAAPDAAALAAAMPRLVAALGPAAVH